MLAEGPVIAVHQSEAVLAAMDDWNRPSARRLGPHCERVLASRVDTAAAERRRCDFLETWAETGRSPMCGNSICQDRRFLARLMPSLERFFHYRNLDVSTLKELAQRWAPQVAQGLRKAPRISRSTTCASRSANSQYLSRAPAASVLIQRTAGRWQGAPPDVRRAHAGLSPARNIQVSTTLSGFRDTLSMP